MSSNECVPCRSYIELGALAQKIVISAASEEFKYLAVKLLSKCPTKAASYEFKHPPPNHLKIFPSIPRDPASWSTQRWSQGCEPALRARRHRGLAGSREALPRALRHSWAQPPMLSRKGTLSFFLFFFFGGGGGVALQGNLVNPKP